MRRKRAWKSSARYYKKNSHDESWGVLGEPERSVFFFPEGRTYSPPGRRPGGGSLPVGQAVRSPRGMRLLREPTDNAAETAIPVIIVCAEGSVHRSLHLRKPAPGSFIAKAGHPKSLACFLFCERETEKGNTEVIATGNIPLGGEGHQQRHRSIRMRSIGLYELLHHL